MKTTLKTVIAVSGVAALALVGLSACASSNPAPTETSGIISGVPSPVEINIADANGMTYEIPLNSAGYITTPKGQESGWSAKFSQEGVVTFIDGGQRGSALYNPGLDPVAPGTTEVTLTNGSTTVTFTVTVTGKSAGSQLVAPTMIDISTANAQTFDIGLGSAGDVLVPAGEEADWSATFSKEGVVSFEPGGERGTAIFNPGLNPVAAGTTEVTMTNSKTGTTVTFTVNVAGK